MQTEQCSTLSDKTRSLPHAGCTVTRSCMRHVLGSCRTQAPCGAILEQSRLLQVSDPLPLTGPTQMIDGRDPRLLNVSSPRYMDATGFVGLVYREVCTHQIECTLFQPWQPCHNHSAAQT